MDIDKRIAELENELYKLGLQKQRQEDLKEYVGKYFYDEVNESFIKVVELDSHNDYEFYTIELCYDFSDDDYENKKNLLWF